MAERNVIEVRLRRNHPTGSMIVGGENPITIGYDVWERVPELTQEILDLERYIEWREASPATAGDVSQNDNVPVKKKNKKG